MTDQASTTDTVAVAVDVGGTTVKAGLYVAGSLTDVRETPTAGLNGPRDLVVRIAGIVDDLVETGRTRGSTPSVAGVVVPGVVDTAAGVIVESVNLGWVDVPIGEMLQSKLGLPLVVGHDIRAGALAEARTGAGRGFNPVLFAAVGTGLGFALVDEGRVREGGTRFTGELGQLQIHTEGATVESVVSAPGIARAFEIQSGLAEGSMDAAAVVTALRNGDPVAARVWEAAVDQLALVLTSAVLVVGAPRVVIGGGLAAAGSILLDPLRRAIAARSTFGEITSVGQAAYGRHAACVGAGILAVEQSRP